MTTERELELVELVTPSGDAIGSATVERAHTAPGSLHRAFSVLLFDDDRRTLLQQRAAVKTRFPLRWANACCGHPNPGESVITAASHRLSEELGVTGVNLVEAGVYTYRASDPETGRVEYEYDHVLIGRVRANLGLTADPAEVAATRWVPTEALSVATSEYAPWLAGVLSVAWTSTTLSEMSSRTVTGHEQTGEAASRTWRGRLR
jgi:isopentenyl-diphosphate delta-isomerase